MMVFSKGVSSCLSIFCGLGSLFETLRFLCALYIPYDIISKCHTLKAISSWG